MAQIANGSGTLQINPLLQQLLTNQGSQVATNANQILNGTDAGQQLANREQILNQANGGSQNMLSDLLHNKPGGYVTNAAPLQGQQNTNVAGDNSMTLNALLGIIGKATDMQTNAVNAATPGATQGMNSILNGIDPTTGQFNQGNADGSGGQLGSVSDINKYSSLGGKSLFDMQPTTLGKLQLAGAINAAGGLAAYRKANPPTDLTPADLQSLTGQANLYGHVKDVMDTLKSDKKLQQTLGDPYSNYIIDHMPPAIAQSILGLTPKEMEVYNKLNSLNASSDYQNVRGRLDNYLTQRFGSSSVGKDQKASTNLAILEAIANDTNHQLGAVAKSKGYGSADDLANVLTAPK